MLYEKYKKCNKKECNICKDGPAHGPYVYANAPDENGKNRELYIGILGSERALEKVENFNLVYPGILEEYKEMLLNRDEIEYVEKRIDISEELDEKAYRAGINIQEFVIKALEKETKNIALEKNWKSKRRRDKKI